MSDEKFKRALHEAMMRNAQSTEVQEPHVFSQKFERNMEKLIRRREKPWYCIINTAGKRIACVAVLVAAVSSMAVLHTVAQRGRYEDFGITIYPDRSVVVPAEVNEDDPRTIEERYEITYDLSGFEIDFCVYESDATHIRYMLGEKEVTYSQSVKWDYDVTHNTELATFVQAYVNGHEVIGFVDRYGHYNLIWENGDYIFKINTNLGKDAAIEMAESVQKVEK